MRELLHTHNIERLSNSIRMAFESLSKIKRQPSPTILLHSLLSFGCHVSTQPLLLLYHKQDKVEDYE